MSLNLNPEPASRVKSKSYKKALRVSGAISLVGVGSTFAANITLNGDQNVEFGQGVAQTLSCDDQVSINPVSYYDNESGSFRLDYVEVSGINLIPVGAISGTYDASASPQYEQYGDASVIAAHPGQYYDSDNNTWANTCDQVVLDFKAFTDQTKYSTNTVDGYHAVVSDRDATPNTISSPLLWSVPEPDGIVRGHSAQNYNNFTDVSSPNIGIIWDAQNDINNKAVQNLDGNHHIFAATFPSDDGGTGYVKESSFKFFSAWGHYNNYEYRPRYDPSAGAISKITVESMKYFPSNGYYLFDDGSEALGKKPN